MHAGCSLAHSRAYGNAGFSNHSAGHSNSSVLQITNYMAAPGCPDMVGGWLHLQSFFGCFILNCAAPCSLWRHRFDGWIGCMCSIISSGLAAAGWLVASELLNTLNCQTSAVFGGAYAWRMNRHAPSNPRLSVLQVLCTVERQAHGRCFWALRVHC